jgi:diaminopimelate epimerase
MREKELKLERVSFVRPSGNDTAIVWDQIRRADHSYVASLIQQNFPWIEQVMFVEVNSETKVIYGQMAGGEFCANAVRSLAYLLTQGQSKGIIDLNVSGVDEPISAMLLENSVSIKIPLKSNAKSFIDGLNNNYTVDLGGIIHIVSFEGDALFNQINSISDAAQRKMAVRMFLNAGTYINYPACGMMLVRRKNNFEMEVDPFVYVRDTGTLYNETACASGSAAIAIINAAQRKATVQNLRVFQPSGMVITVDVSYQNGNLESVTVGGEVSVLYDGKITLLCPVEVIQNGK